MKDWRLEKGARSRLGKGLVGRLCDGELVRRREKFSRREKPE